SSRPPLNGVSDRSPDFHLCAAIAGAAAWSIGIALLAMLHLYSQWVVVPLVTVTVAAAISDAMAARALEPAVGRRVLQQWGVVVLVLRLAFVGLTSILLMTIVLWGNAGDDNDLLGHYLPYYEAVLRNHWNGPNDYWVQFFISKGNGLALFSSML